MKLTLADSYAPEDNLHTSLGISDERAKELETLTVGIIEKEQELEKTLE